jgi:hypothetical protein
LTENKKTAGNSTYTQVGVQCIYDSEVLNPSSVLSMMFSAKNPHLRVAAKRCMQPPNQTKDYERPYKQKPTSHRTLWPIPNFG